MPALQAVEALGAPPFLSKGTYLSDADSVPAISVGAALRQLLWYLIAGTRGGANRARIIEALRDHPYNANQLTEALRLDYRTIRHHLALLEKNGLVSRPTGDAYAAPYFLSPYLEGNYAVFEEIRARLRPPGGRFG